MVPKAPRLPLLTLVRGTQLIPIVETDAVDGCAKSSRLRRTLRCARRRVEQLTERRSEGCREHRTLKHPSYGANQGLTPRETRRLRRGTRELRECAPCCIQNGETY